MEYRKIQVTGEGTYIVSLPKKWVKRNQLSKKDIISVIERGDELLLRLKEEKEQETEIKIETDDIEFLSMSLITKYIQGYDTIVITSKDYINPELKRKLINISTYLIGLEPFGETKNKLTFKMLMKERGQLMESVDRMHQMSILSLRELMDDLEMETYNEDILDGIIQRDDEIDKFYFLILRQLSSMSGFEASVWVQIAKSIERISDHIEKIATLTKECKKIGKKDIMVYKELIGMYNDVMLALKNKNPSRANDVMKKIQKFRLTEKKIIDKLNEDKDHCILIYESFRRIGEYLSDISESVINMS
ncbi:MAG: PhoU domain-containing protein [Candidatus Altiarchaeota archaeon]|nr:PhoU domain-containing protein [Candidatus Altiarchaeota archaeon]